MGKEGVKVENSWQGTQYPVLAGGRSTSQTTQGDICPAWLPYVCFSFPSLGQLLHVTPIHSQTPEEGSSKNKIQTHISPAALDALS